MIVPLTTHLTPEDFEFMSGTRGVELIDGELKEKNVGYECGIVTALMLKLLGRYLDTNPVGILSSNDAGFICFPHRPRLVRKPDISFVLNGRFPNNRGPRGYARMAPDLAVEIVSPNDSHYEVEEKLNDYLLAIVPVIWIVNPDSRTVHIYLADGTIRRLTADQELTGEPLFPGFRVRVGDLFPPPLESETPSP